MTITRRLKRIFRADGRTVIVPMDHGLIFGETGGLCDPARLIAAVVAGGADAALVPAGMARRFAAELAPLGLVVRADRAAPVAGESEAPGACCAGVDECLRLGADAVMAFGFPGAAQGEASLQRLADLTSEAHRWGLPVLAEMLPGGFERLGEMLNLDSLLRAARVATDMGVDCLKLPYIPGLERITAACYVPVVVLGGARRGDQANLFADVRAAMDAGAAGVAIGRNVFQAPDPAAMAAALSAVVHDGASVADALAVLAERMPARQPAT